ncbi:FAD dependent oxidoreductase superfamily [Grosmannia clavigera kw1407]|uniref:FAD dependent oxidoreductase superfamily n=1 Tax=Grosmannia clavigera (strain kw1407 / UAMH 11150) TaxID=655863 RepID=F0XGF6_GROCL|nr:FAD dependent oxidoreductase superfamily [Grosmannia clavigera kw1407]EFX03293.1 FAD dependent oxidoreductase superfamily [Grosmannia clavigera kw1407]
MAPSPLPVPGSTTSFWRTDPLPLDNHRSTPDLPAEVDLVVIGAGYAGASTVHHILKTCRDRGLAPPSIAVLEAREACSGATGRNGGQLKPDPYYRPIAIVPTHGLAIAAECANFEAAHVPAIKQLVEDEQIDCDFVLTRCCDVFLDADHWTRTRTALEQLRAHSSPDGLPSLRDLFVVADAADAERLSGVKGSQGLVTYSAGHVWPYKMVHALLSKAVAQGVNLQTHTPVIAVATPDGPDGPVLLTTPRGSIRARRVVYATNGYTSSVLPEFAGRIVPSRGICSHIAVPGTPSAQKSPPPLSSTVSATSGPFTRPAQLAHSYMVRANSVAYEYLIPRLDGGIVVGGARSVFMNDLASWYDNVRDDEIIDKAAHYFDGYMQRHFFMGYSTDNMPHIGAIPGRPNQFIIAGFTGHGMPQVFLSAKAVAAMVLDDVPFEATGVPRLFKASQERLDSTRNQVLEITAGCLTAPSTTRVHFALLPLAMHATLSRPAKGFWGRSFDELRRLTGIVVRFEGIKGPSGPYQLQSFRDAASLDDCKIMTDDEIGGFSTAQIDWVPSTSSSAGYVRFHGSISTRLPDDRPDVKRTGYAAWRTADRLPTVFGRSVWNVDSYAYLAMRVRSDGRSYLINVQTDSIVAPTDLHQHRLFARRPGQWETVVVPWGDFVRTNHGFVVEPQTELLRQRLRSVGLGLTDRVPGPFELCIAGLWATNNPEEAEHVEAVQFREAEEAQEIQETQEIQEAAAGRLRNKHGRPVRWDSAPLPQPQQSAQ